MQHRAAFTGTRITLRQVSPESEAIFDFIIELYKTSNGDWAPLQKTAGVSDDDLKYFLEYAAMFLGNCGNYKGFGDAKFIPRCGEQAFAALAATSPAASEFYKQTNGAIFSTGNDGMMQLGFLDEGHVTTYYPNSEKITKAEISSVSEWMQMKKLLPVCTSFSFSARKLPASYGLSTNYAVGKHTSQKNYRWYI